MCTDYVTEKFFNVLKYNMVPVTYNGAEMEKFAPRHSYINALDFSSVEELAKYLEKVILHLYNRILPACAFVLEDLGNGLHDCGTILWKSYIGPEKVLSNLIRKYKTHLQKSPEK